MKQFLSIILGVFIISMPIYSADNSKAEAEAVAAMEKVVDAIKQCNGPVLKTYFEDKLMVSEAEKFARMFRATQSYDGFDKNSGLLYAVFFDTMKMRSQLRPFVSTDHYFCLRDVLSKGDGYQIGQDVATGTYRIAGRYRDSVYYITLRKNGSFYRIITISLPKKK